MSRQILTLDSSQIEKFLDCDQEWDYAYRENLELTRVGTPREDMQMGSFGHKILEIYYHNKALGVSPVDAMDEALALSPDPFGVSPTNAKKVITACNRHFTYYGGRDVTVLMGAPTRKANFNEDGSFRGETWELNPLVEKGFSYPLLDTPDFLFILEGRIDLLCDQGGTQAFMDHKFQSRETKLYKKSIQFRNYGMVTGVKLGIINYIRYHKELGAETLQRSLISFGAFEHEWWKKELIRHYHKIAAAVKSGDFDKRWNSCKGKFGYPCQFTQLCNERNDAVRENIKSQYYSIKEAWKPW